MRMSVFSLFFVLSVTLKRSGRLFRNGDLKQLYLSHQFNSDSRRSLKYGQTFTATLQSIRNAMLSQQSSWGPAMR